MHPRASPSFLIYLYRRRAGNQATATSNGSGDRKTLPPIFIPELRQGRRLLGLEDMGQLWTLLSHLNTLAGPTIMLLYPLYASVRAIETPSKLDDEQWLAYWILYSFLTLTEMVAEPILCWVPFWYQLKVAFVAWLVLPQFRGAAFIYDRLVRERLKRYRA